MSMNIRGTRLHVSTTSRAHDLRAFAASWNALQEVSTRDILRAAHWRSHNTFTAFYLVDLSVIEEDMYKIGPLVTGHHITRQ